MLLKDAAGHLRGGNHRSSHHPSLICVKDFLDQVVLEHGLAALDACFTGLLDAAFGIGDAAKFTTASDPTVALWDAASSVATTPSQSRSSLQT